MSDRIVENEDQEEILEGPPPEEVERLWKLRPRLTDFILHLVQALLRAGYYTPAHPESKRLKEGLYDEFRGLFGQEDELTFLVTEDQERQEILVESFLPETERLSRMMLKGMAEIYVPKFARYFERKDLVSLTLKGRMDQVEFSRFIDILSDPMFEDKEGLSQALFENGVFNLSFVFNEELLAQDRKMPWRARVTLSRMRKDLKMIPYFQKMSGQELGGIRRKLLHDSIRPIRQSNIFYAILQHSDLAATPENREEIIEDEVVAFLQRQYLMGISQIFLREHRELKKGEERDDFEIKSFRLLNKITQRLKEIRTQEAENLLEEFFRRELIGLDDLPPWIKEKIVLQRLTNEFLRYTDQFFERLDQAKEQETFLKTAFDFVKIIPELIRRDRYPEILRIFETFNRHFHEKKMWALLAGQILEEIGTGEVPELLKQKFLTVKKESRTAIIPILANLEVGAIPHLLAILKTSVDQWVRKNACEALIQIGPVAAVHLMEELEQERLPAETIGEILRVMGEINSQQWKVALSGTLKKYIAHEDPKLREQAIRTLCKIGGAEEEEIFLSSLNDPEVEVQKRAIWCLGMIRSIRGFERMMEILDLLSTLDAPEKDQLETQIYYTFGMSGNPTISGQTVEETLLDILEKRGTKGWKRPFEKNPLSGSSITAICSALGHIGTSKSVRSLTQLAKAREGAWVPMAKEALKKIEERTGDLNLS